MSKKNFHFVIGKPWDDNDPTGELCIYAYHSQVHYGTMKDATPLLDYVLRDKDNKGFSIYKVNFEKVEKK